MLPNQRDELRGESVVVDLGTGLERDEARRALTLEWVVHTEYRALGDRGMQGEHLLERACGQPVPGDVDHIVGAAHHVEVAVLVEVAGIPGGVEAGEGRQVGALEAVLAAPDAQEGAGRQRESDGDIAVFAGLRDWFALGIEDGDVVAGHRERGRSRFGGDIGDAPGVRADRPAGFGLPPVVDHRAVQPVIGPVVGLRVESLAGQEKPAQALDVVLGQLDQVRVYPADGTDGRGRREQDRHLVVRNDAPERPGIGGAHRFALVDHRGGADQQRGVDDVGVPDHPADVGGRPEHVPGQHAVDVGHRPGQRHGVAAVVAHDALRVAGRPGGVQDVQRVVGAQADRGRRDGLVLFVGPVQPGHVAGAGVVGGAAGDRLPVAHDDGAHRALAPGESPFDQRQVLDRPARFEAAGGGHDHGRPRVVDPHGEFAGGEAAEDDGVDGADAGAGKHGDDGFRDHREVDDHSVALADAVGAEHPGEAFDAAEKFQVAQSHLGAGHRRVVDDGRLVSASSEHVPVERVVAGVELTVGEPAPSAGGALLERDRRRGDPVDRLRCLQPERRTRAGIDALPPQVVVPRCCFPGHPNLPIEVPMYT